MEGKWVGTHGGWISKALAISIANGRGALSKVDARAQCIETDAYVGVLCRVAFDLPTLECARSFCKGVATTMILKRLCSCLREGHLYNGKGGNE